MEQMGPSMVRVWTQASPALAHLTDSHHYLSPAEYGENRGGPESLDLPEDSQHLNPACYPSTCLTGILLSYKHPEVSFSMEQAGV